MNAVKVKRPFHFCQNHCSQKLEQFDELPFLRHDNIQASLFLLISNHQLTFAYALGNFNGNEVLHITFERFRLFVNVLILTWYHVTSKNMWMPWKQSQLKPSKAFANGILQSQLWMRVDPIRKYHQKIHLEPHIITITEYC